MFNIKKSPHVLLEVYHILKYIDSLPQEEPTIQYHTGILTYVGMWDTLSTDFLGLRIKKNFLGLFKLSMLPDLTNRVARSAISAIIGRKRSISSVLLLEIWQ